MRPVHLPLWCSPIAVATWAGPPVEQDATNSTMDVLTSAWSQHIRAYTPAESRTPEESTWMFMLESTHMDLAVSYGQRHLIYPNGFSGKPCISTSFECWPPELFTLYILREQLSARLTTFCTLTIQLLLQWLHCRNQPPPVSSNWSVPPPPHLLPLSCGQRMEPHCPLMGIPTSTHRWWLTDGILLTTTF